MKTDSTLSRRRLLASMPAVAIGASTALPATSSDTDEQDAELLALGRQADEFFTRYYDIKEAESPLVPRRSDFERLNSVST